MVISYIYNPPGVINLWCHAGSVASGMASLILIKRPICVIITQTATSGLGLNKNIGRYITSNYH